MHKDNNTSIYAKLVFALFVMPGIAIGGMLRRVEPKLPASIRAVESFSDLGPFISDSNELMREAAVVRVGQLDEPSAATVRELVGIFEREPRKIEIHANPMVRRQVVYALGGIGSTLARQTLETLLAKYLEEGPLAGRYVWMDGEYLIMIDSILSELARWKDARAKQTLESIYRNESYFYGIREFAYYSLLTLRFHELGLASPELQMRYLAQELQNCGNKWAKGKNGVKTESGVRNRTIYWRLYQFGEPAIPVIENELEKVPANQAERRKALARTKAGILKRAEYLRKKEQRQTKKEEE